MSKRFPLLLAGGGAICEKHNELCQELSQTFTTEFLWYKTTTPSYNSKQKTAFIQ